MNKLVRVCPLCSNIDIDKLKEQIGENNVKSGCVGACRKDKVKYFGRINGSYTLTKTEEEFIEECK